jgi:hypothetical protein
MISGAPNRVSKSDQIMLDSDWIKGNYTYTFPLNYYSYNIMQSAISNDTKFLASHNIMDYSLLIGVCGKESTLICGIVGNESLIIDYIGTFTFYKNIESQSKCMTSISPTGNTFP